MTALELYRKHLALFEAHRNTIPPTDTTELLECDEEIARIRLHIHRLENDHADCVEPCCMGCKLGGLPPEERGEVHCEVVVTEVKP